MWTKFSSRARGCSYAILEEVKLVLFLLISNEVDHYVHP